MNCLEIVLMWSFFVFKTKYNRKFNNYNKRYEKNCKTNRYVLEKSIKVISVEKRISERYVSKAIDKAIKMFERMFGKNYLKL